MGTGESGFADGLNTSSDTILNLILITSEGGNDYFLKWIVWVQKEI